MAATIKDIGNKPRNKKAEVTATVRGPASDMDVTVARDESEREVGEERLMGDLTWPRAVRPQPWWRRLLGLGGPDKVMIDARQMEDLRNSVMEELRSRNDSAASAELSVAGVKSSRPFERVLLPEGGSGGRRGGDWVFSVFVLVALLVIVGLLLLGGRTPGGPEGILAQLNEAIEKGDVEAFNKVVDVPAVTASVVDQAYPAPVVEVASLPAHLRESVSGTGKIAAQVVKPGLAAALADDLNEAVAAREIPANGTSLLRRLWVRAGGDELQVGVPRVVSRQKDTATAEAMVTRNDTGLAAEVLTLKLAERDGRWRVVDVPNAGQVMDRLAVLGSGARPVIAEAKPEDVSPAAASPVAVSVSSPQAVPLAQASGLVVDSVEKTSGAEGPMLVTLAMRNMAGYDLTRAVVRLTLSDKRGVPLEVIEMTDTKAWRAGEARTRTLSVPVNRRRNVERQVAELPLSALLLRAEVVAVH